MFRRQPSCPNCASPLDRGANRCTVCGVVLDAGQPTGWTPPPLAPALGELAGFAMPVDDVFAIKGRGTVATGQIAAGTVNIGDVLLVEAGGSRPVQVVCRGIEMFRKTLTSATVGDNVGLLLDGVTREQLAPGAVLRGR